MELRQKVVSQAGKSDTQEVALPNAIRYLGTLFDRTSRICRLTTSSRLFPCQSVVKVELNML